MIYIENPAIEPAEQSEMAQEQGRLVCQICGHIFPDYEDYFDTPEGALCEDCAEELADMMLENWRHGR